MSTITTIASTDTPRDSRSVINTNFVNLNTDKIETSVLDTDTSLTADSDAKVATQKAVKTYVDTQVATNSTPTCLSYIPKPQFVSGDDLTSTRSITGSTTGFIYQFSIPFKITANKISIRPSAVSVAGTFILSLFTEDGQTRVFSVTTASISSSILYTTDLSAVVIEPGNYYLMIQPVSTANAAFYVWQTVTVPFSTADGLVSDITGKPVLGGTYTVTADTAPATITPTSVAESGTNYALIVRLDN